MSRPEAPYPDDARGMAHPIHGNARSEASSSLAENFDIDILNADARLKLKKRFGPIRLGANCTLDCPRVHGADNIDWKLTLRPAFPRQSLTSTVFNKLAIQPKESKVRWSMGTLKWRFLKLKVDASYDWETRQPAYNYRVMTALSKDDECAFHKKTVAWNNRVKVQPRYDYELSIPSMQGGNQRDTKVDPFMFRFGLKVVDTVVNLDRRPDSFFPRKADQAFNNPLGPLGEPDAKVQIITIGQPARRAQNQEGVVNVKDKSTIPTPAPAPSAPRASTPPSASFAPTRPILAPGGKGLSCEDAKRRVWDPVQRFVMEHPVKFVREHPIKLPWGRALE